MLDFGLRANFVMANHFGYRLHYLDTVKTSHLSRSECECMLQCLVYGVVALWG